MIKRRLSILTSIYECENCISFYAAYTHYILLQGYRLALLHLFFRRNFLNGPFLQENPRNLDCPIKSLDIDGKLCTKHSLIIINIPLHYCCTCVHITDVHVYTLLLSMCTPLDHNYVLTTLLRLFLTSLNDCIQ